MTLRLLLSGLLLCVGAHAAEDFVDDKDLEPHMQELRTRLEHARKNSLKIDDLVGYYQQQSVAKGTPKQRAINAYMYGFVLMNVLVDKKDVRADAKREIQRALDLVPKFPSALVGLALLADSARDSAGAEEYLRRALEIQPGYLNARLMQGEMALKRGDLERTREIFERTLETEATVRAYSALAGVYLGLFHKTYDEKEKDRFAKRALAAAEAVKTLEPENQALRVLKAEVYLKLGRPLEAIDYLEGLYAAGDLKPEVKLRMLGYLGEIYQRQGNVEGAKRTAERVLACENVRPQERAKIAGRLKDFDTYGRNAFVKWQVEDAIENLENDGLSVEARVAYLRVLWDFINGDAIDHPGLRALVKMAWDACFRTLVDGPPEVVVLQLRALRNGMPVQPGMMPVLVHFIYPEGRTPEIREEGVRTIAALTGPLAIPALYYTLQCDQGNVVREADNQLSLLCERRSPLGGGIEPYTQEQRRQVLLYWTKYFHTADGSERLAKSFGQLAKAIVKVQPDRTSAPMIDHAGHVLLDDDVPWEAWSACYDFLVRYWGKEFRPVERRGKPVEPFEREAIAKAFDEEFRGERPGVDPDKPTPAPKGMAAKGN